MQQMPAMRCAVGFTNDYMRMQFRLAVPILAHGNVAYQRQYFDLLVDLDVLVVLFGEFEIPERDLAETTDTGEAAGIEALLARELEQLRDNLVARRENQDECFLSGVLLDLFAVHGLFARCIEYEGSLAFCQYA